MASNRNPRSRAETQTVAVDDHATPCAQQKLLGVDRPMTLAYVPPGVDSTPRTIDLMPGVINRVPLDVWAAILARAGDDVIDGWKQRSMLWELSETEAQQIVDSGGRPINPRPDLGLSTFTPKLPPPRTPGEAAISTALLDGDPNRDEMPISAVATV